MNTYYFAEDDLWYDALPRFHRFDFSGVEWHDWRGGITELDRIVERDNAIIYGSVARHWDT